MPEKIRRPKRPPSSKTLGMSLASIRKLRGLTQVELARKVGLPQQYISQYECGKIRIPAPMVVTFARILRVTADELLGMGAHQVERVDLDRRFARRLLLIGTLTRRDQEALLRTIDVYLAQIGKGSANGSHEVNGAFD